MRAGAGAVLQASTPSDDSQARNLDSPPSPRYARALNNATHWAFGLAAGAGYGLLLGSRHKAKVAYGPPFGAAVWANGYVVLPLLGVYEPIWHYDLETLGKDLRAHLVFGTATAAAFWLLDRGRAGS